MQDVITYQSPNGFAISLCKAHDTQAIRDPHGAEYCTVSHGRHAGYCDLCRAEGRPLDEQEDI